MSIWGLGLLGLLLAIGGGVGVYALTARWFENHPIGPAIFTATASAIIASMFSPWMTDRLNRKRDDENHRWTMRQNHLNSLRPVLRGAADELQRMVTRLDSDGFYADPDAATGGREYQPLWQEGNPLADDLINHFKRHDAERQFLKGTLRNHDRLYQRVRNDLLKLVEQANVASTDKGLQLMIRDELLNRCRGKEAVFVIGPPIGNSFSYAVSRNRNKMPLQYLPEFEAALKFFNAYTAPAGVQLACRTLHNDLHLLSENGKALSVEALQLSEGASLPGDCPYLRVD